MSYEEFEVRGPHDDEELEHAGGDSFSSKIVVITAVLATAGASISYQAGSTPNEAAMFKNDAAIKKTEASDKWSFYQAKSNKKNLAELAIAITNINQAKYAEDIQYYGVEKVDIKKAARKTRI